MFGPKGMLRTCLWTYFGVLDPDRWVLDPIFPVEFISDLQIDLSPTGSEPGGHQVEYYFIWYVTAVFLKTVPLLLHMNGIY